MNVTLVIGESAIAVFIFYLFFIFEGFLHNQCSFSCVHVYAVSESSHFHILR